MKRYLSTPIGVFDSGVGGLSVFRELIKLLPDEHYIYFGDTKNLPYGNKSAEEIIAFGKNTLNFFRSKGVRHVVMACNTSSALAYDTLKCEFPDIKIYPIIQDVARTFTKYSQIGVMATVGTVNSRKYTEEILKNNPCANVFEEACERFVEIVENRLYDLPGSIDYIEKKLKALLVENVEKIVLGCTHYPYLMPIFTKFAPVEMFIDPSVIFAKNIAVDIKSASAPCFEGGKKEFFVSGNAQSFIDNAKIFYDEISERNVKVILHSRANESKERSSCETNDVVKET